MYISLSYKPTGCKIKYFNLLDKSGVAFYLPFNKTVYCGYNHSEKTIKHEYGHFIQHKQNGMLKFIFKYGIPSIISFTFDRKNHRTKWFEVDADLKGGVHDDKQKIIYKKEDIK